MFRWRVGQFGWGAKSFACLARFKVSWRFWLSFSFLSSRFFHLKYPRGGWSGVGFRVSRLWISWRVDGASFDTKAVVFLAGFRVRLAFGFLVKMARFWLEKVVFVQQQGCGVTFFTSQNLKVKTGLTSRAADKCGRSAALVGSLFNGGFGVWRFFLPIPALAANALPLGRLKQ